MDIRLFAGVHTRSGFVSLFSEFKEVFNLKKLFILKGCPGCGKNTFMKNFRKSFPDEKAILICCCADPDSLDGVIFPHLGVAMVDGTSPHVIQPLDDNDVVINLSPNVMENEYNKLTKRREKCYKKVYFNMQKAYNLHMKSEKLYNDRIDFLNHKKLLKEACLITKNID